MTRKSEETKKIESKISQAMKSGRQLAAFEIANEIGVSVKKVGSILGNMIKAGVMHNVGYKKGHLNKMVNIYCVNKTQKTVTKQTWFSMIGE